MSSLSVSYSDCAFILIKLAPVGKQLYAKEKYIEHASLQEYVALCPCYKLTNLRLNPLCAYVLTHLQHYCFLNKVTCSDELLKNSVKNSKQILLRIGIAEYTLLAVEMF